MSITFPSPAPAAPAVVVTAAAPAGPDAAVLPAVATQVLITARSTPARPLRPEPLPLPTPAWGVDEALEAVAEARLVLPVPADAVVVSALTTVVLRAGDVAVKVYPPGTDPAHLARIATALAGSTTALLPTAPPVVTSWGVVSTSRWLRAARPVCWAETGAVLRRFHDDHADADVAAWDPLRRLPGQVEGLPDDVAGVLLDARETLLDALDGLRPPLGTGVVHGDVSPSNVLHDGDAAVLIDLDFVARAPREYDLSSAARRFDAGEVDAGTYLAFCRAYGADVRSWDGRVVLDQVARLGGVAFRLWDDRRRGLTPDWAADAVRDWRTPL